MFDERCNGANEAAKMVKVIWMIVKHNWLTLVVSGEVITEHFYTKEGFIFCITGYRLDYIKKGCAP